MPSMKKVGYAVMGLGGISQVAVLPGFTHSEQAELELGREMLVDCFGDLG